MLVLLLFLARFLARLPTRPSRRWFGKSALQAGGMASSTWLPGLCLTAELALTALITRTLAFRTVWPRHFHALPCRINMVAVSQNLQLMRLAG